MEPPPRLAFDPIAEAHRHWVAHGWSEAADGMAAVTSIMRAQQLVQGRVDEALRPLGLTFSRYELLMLLHFSRSGELPVTKASLRLQVHPTSVTNAVDRLEAAGFVERRRHPSDGRATLIRITDAGRDVALTATKQLNEVFAAPLLPTTKVRRLLHLLTDLRQRAGDFA